MKKIIMLIVLIISVKGIIFSQPNIVDTLIFKNGIFYSETKMSDSLKNICKNKTLTINDSDTNSVFICEHKIYPYTRFEEVVYSIPKTSKVFLYQETDDINNYIELNKLEELVQDSVIIRKKKITLVIDIQ